MKINLGCGFKKIDGFLNIDIEPKFFPDKILDLEKTPWDIESNSVDYILMEHIFEHLGQTPSSFINIMKELYRIGKNNCEIFIRTPHPYHYTYICDPTHVRPITPELLAPWSKRQCIYANEKHVSQTNFAHIHDVDFELDKIKYIWDKNILYTLREMNLVPSDLEKKCYDDVFTRIFSNLVLEIEIKLLIKK